MYDRLFNLLFNKFWKMFLLGGLAMVWITANVWANGLHFSYILAGIVTSIVLFVMSIIYADNDE